jgi:outer membrane protein assembly factor BamA
MHLFHTRHWLLAACLWAASLGGLAAQDSLAQARRLRFFGLPLVFYSTDTRWGYGAGGVLTFKGNPLRSSVTFSLAYTQRKQWLLWFPFQWFGPSGRLRAYGELGWYRYLYQHFGIGNRVPNDFIETYTAQYPRLRLTFAKNLNARQLLGLRLAVDDFQMRETQPGGEVATGKLPGGAGGLSSGLGLVYLLDSRDNQFFPRRGWFVELSLLGEHRLTGSDFRYARLGLDAARYWPLGRKAVLATHCMAQSSTPGIPFFLMPSLGGSRRLRGYPDFKFRDRHLLLLQSELRFPIWWRLKGVVFAATGSVFGTPDEALRWRPNGGAGLRFEFDRKQKLHLRVDYGIGALAGNSSMYLTFGEAF